MSSEGYEDSPAQDGLEVVEGHLDEEDPDTGGELVDHLRVRGEEAAEREAQEVEDNGEEEGGGDRVEDGYPDVGSDF